MNEKEFDEYIWALAEHKPHKKYMMYCTIEMLDFMIKIFKDNKSFVKVLKENRKKLSKLNKSYGQSKKND